MSSEAQAAPLVVRRPLAFLGDADAAACEGDACLVPGASAAPGAPAAPAAESPSA